MILASLIGFAAPLTMAPLLLVQIIYKGTWLAAYAWPRRRSGGPDAVPRGITGTFALIVVTYPFALWWAWV